MTEAGGSHRRPTGIPPTQLGDLFKSGLLTHRPVDLRNTPDAVGGSFNTSLLAALGHQRISKAIRALVSVPTNARPLDRLHMNHPPTPRLCENSENPTNAVGGLFRHNLQRAHAGLPFSFPSLPRVARIENKTTGGPRAALLVGWV